MTNSYDINNFFPFAIIIIIIIIMFLLSTIEHRHLTVSGWFLNKVDRGRVKRKEKRILSFYFYTLKDYYFSFFLHPPRFKQTINPSTVQATPMLLS